MASPAASCGPQSPDRLVGSGRPHARMPERVRIRAGGRLPDGLPLSGWRTCDPPGIVNQRPGAPSRESGLRSRSGGPDLSLSRPHAGQVRRVNGCPCVRDDAPEGDPRDQRYNPRQRGRTHGGRTQAAAGKTGDARLPNGGDTQAHHDHQEAAGSTGRPDRLPRGLPASAAGGRAGPPGQCRPPALPGAGGGSGSRCTVVRRRHRAGGSLAAPDVVRCRPVLPAVTLRGTGRDGARPDRTGGRGHPRLRP